MPAPSCAVLRPQRQLAGFSLSLRRRFRRCGWPAGLSCPAASAASASSSLQSGFFPRASPTALCSLAAPPQIASSGSGPLPAILSRRVGAIARSGRQLAPTSVCCARSAADRRREDQPRRGGGRCGRCACLSPPACLPAASRAAAAAFRACAVGCGGGCSGGASWLWLAVASRIAPQRQAVSRGSPCRSGTARSNLAWRRHSQPAVRGAARGHGGGRSACGCLLRRAVQRRVPRCPLEASVRGSCHSAELLLLCFCVVELQGMVALRTLGSRGLAKASVAMRRSQPRLRR